MESLHRRSAIWFVAAATFSLLATCGVLFDRSRSDEALIAEASASLSSQFQQGIATLESDPYAKINIPYCRLTYGPDKKLISWSNAAMLPTDSKVDFRKLKTTDDHLFSDPKRNYYRLRVTSDDTTHLLLVPVKITYEVENQYLPTYMLLGSYKDQFSTQEKTDLLARTDTLARLSQLQVKSAAGKVVVGYDNWSVKAMRRPVRNLILVMMLLAFVFFGIFAKMMLAGRSARTMGNVSLAVAFLALGGRFLLNTSSYLRDSFAGEMFSPRILAFNDLAPSLGDFTLNVITLTVIIGALYTFLFRRMLPFVHWIIQRIWLRIPVSLVSWLAIAGLMKLYFGIFSAIILNSQVEIEFSNFFKTSSFAFLLLADMGLLVLIFIFLALLLLRPMVLIYRRSEDHGTYLAIHIMCAAGALAVFFRDDWVMLLIGMVVLSLLLLTGIRYPFRHLIRQDLTNLLLLLTISSLMATNGLIRGQNLSSKSRTELIARRVLGTEGAKLGSLFERATYEIGDNKDQVLLKYSISNPTNFREWLRTNYFVKNFHGSNVWVYVFHAEDGTRIDKSSGRNPTYDPHGSVKLEDIGEPVDVNFYRLLNYDNNDTDLYIGKMEFTSLSGEKILITLEFAPTETEGVFPSLSLNEFSLTNLQLVNRYDYAIYLDGILYREYGHSQFPVRLQVMPSRLGLHVNSVEGGKEFIYDIGSNRTVVVKYKDQSLLSTFTTLSFTFYYFTFLALALIALPVLVLRFAQELKLGFRFPIRARIRFWLLLISLLPLLGIFGLLTPFIRERYTNQASEELSDDTARISRLLAPFYRQMMTDLFTRAEQGESFRRRVQELETMFINDIQVYDQEGLLFATTQPLLYESGIMPDLMNGRAHQVLSRGETSEMLVEETVGKVNYLSAFRPILGKNNEPQGFINVSYLARENTLEDQVFEFIAYLANIYLLVFLLVNLAAVVVADNISKPLSLIRQRLSNLGMGRRAEPIVYESDDEIGALVKSYNEMVSQLVESEKQLAQSQREMAWKQMARQVAHEIKNPLTPMKLSVQMLRRTWKEGDQSRLEKQFPRTMDTLLSQIESMVKIANSFSEFARMPEPEKTNLDLCAILHEVIHLFGSSEGIAWKLDLPENPVWMEADRDQITRTFQNIVLNAIQAMDGEGEIAITLRTENELALVTITDNGPGMDEEVQRRAFEPSFSTKNSGMGLGLAIVKRIVENSNGKIWFESRPDQGTSFFLELPVRVAHEHV